MKLKKVLALVLCVAMVLSTMSFTVFAKPASPVAPEIEQTAILEIAENGYAAEVNGTTYPTIQEAINAAGEGNVVTIAPGEYSGFNISGKKITIQGTVSDEGELLTTIKGGDPAITGSNFDGTIKNLKIADAWKAMYAEPVGNVTIDNVYVTGVTYGFHLVAYQTGITWTIQNSYMDLAWANSFGVYNGGYADIIIRNNKFDSTAPFYSDYGALAVNTYSPSVTVEDNVFGEGAKIYVDKAAVQDTSNINIGANYYADGVENAFADDEDGVTVEIDTFYSEVTEDGKPTGLVDKEKTYVAYAKSESGAVTYYETLQEAVKKAVANDTIYLIGTINEGSIKLPATITNLTIDGQETAVVKNTTINAADGNYVDVQGLTIKNTTFENSRFVLGGMRAGDVIYKDLVFDNNKFINIVDVNSMAAVHMNIGSEDNEYVENFTFTNNVIDGVTGSNNSGVLLKGIKGDVVFKGNTVSNVAWNAVQVATAKADANLVIKNNSFASSGSSVLNIAAAPSAVLENNTIVNDSGRVGLWYPATAKIGDVLYVSLQVAVAALEDGDTLEIATGTYDAVEVLADNVIITGMTDDAEITVGSTTDTAFIGVGGHNVTIEGVKFIVPEEVDGQQNWMTSVIGFASSQQNYGGVEPDGWDVIDCDFVQTGDALGIAIFNCNNFTVDGCTFENFGTGVCTMGDGRALDTVAITDNTFTKVNSPINVYWGQIGDKNGSLTINGNTFVSAKDADEIEIAINDYASAINGVAGIDELDLSGNTFNAATNVIIVDASVSVAEDVKEDLANADNVVIDERYTAVARIGNDKYFTSLKAAAEGAQDGDVIEIISDIIVSETAVFTSDITIDGNGFTVKGKDVTETETNGIAVTPIAINGAEVKLVDINVKGGNAYNNDPLQPTASHGVAGAALNVTDGKVIIDNSTVAGGDAGAEYTKSAGAAIVAENGDIIATNSTLATGRTTRDTVVGVATVYLDADSTIDLTDVVLDTATSGYASDNVISSFHENGIDTTDYTGDVNLDGVIHVIGTRLANVNIVAGENLTFKGNIDASLISDELTVMYVKKDVDAEGNDNDEEADLYDIVISGNKPFINRLTTVDLTFDLTSTTAVAPVYEIIPVAPVTVTENAAFPERYMFNFDGVTQPDETAKEIVIAQVKISGYGTYNFAVDANSEYNVAHATKTNDSIVEEFVPNGGTGKGKLIIDTNKIEEEIVVPTRDLTIAIDFPNEVEKNIEAYQDMTVTISGGDLAKAIEVKLGKDDKEIAIENEYEKDKAKYSVEVADGYVINVTDALTVNNSYTVTVSGAGYRTARYTVTMTTDKQLNFWNNVKDEEQVIEIGNDSVVTVKNFLAGDIVKDNKINIYDLSAVVSYFGSDATIENKYAKYDLNRDGVVDSKDVAYVLVSWDN